MKKNRMMRAASALLIAVLLTTSAISGTFAKYVTTASGSDTARVADWGVTATVTGEAFKTEYAKEDSNYTVTANSVVSSTGDKLVAPGTDGSFGGVALTGSPEVAVRVDYTGTTVELTGWVVGANAEEFYCPLVFNVNGTNIDGKDYDSEVALEDALLAAVTKGAGDYAPNTDLSTIDALIGEYTWSWPFSTGTENDVKDTALGDLEAVSADVDVNTVTFNVNVTVTQID